MRLPEVSACPVFDGSPSRLNYAKETHALALDLFDYIFPPWRWRTWWRQQRIVKARIRSWKETQSA